MSVEQINPENILIEVNESGVVAVHGEIRDTAFVSLIGPAIVHLDEVIQRLQSLVSSEAFKRAVVDNDPKLGSIAADTESTHA